jgi:hypothetical protein
MMTRNEYRLGGLEDWEWTRHTLLRKKLPEMLISSHRTTTIFWPFKICLDIMDASRPRRCPLPSMMMGVEEMVAMRDLRKYE